MTTQEKIDDLGLVLVDKGSHTQLRSKRELKGKEQDQSFTMVLMSLDAHSQIESLPNIINQARKEAYDRLPTPSTWASPRMSPEMLNEDYMRGYTAAINDYYDRIKALKEGK